VAEHALLDHRGEDVADAFVQRARLVLISQSDGELDDTMGVLVRHHIHWLGEAVKDLPIPIAEDELSSVPKCVVVITLVVDGDGDRAAASINGLPTELALEHVPNLAGGIERLVNCGIADREIAIAPDHLPRQCLGVVGAVHHPLFAARQPRGGHLACR
jgi:hypothetical protein